jgi:hypothetical protein
VATKERYQNPAIGDLVNLRLFTYNNNNLADLKSVEKVDIYYLDRFAVTAENPDGRRLVETFDSSSVVIEDTGTHRLQINLEEKKYVIGSYYDIWTVKVSDDQPTHEICNRFEIYPNLWYSTPIPIVYDFSFHFQPNKFRAGSKQFIIIEIIPNVPNAGDLRQYYENVAIVSDLRVSIEQTCGDCLPFERDLRLIADKVLIDYREKRYGYYKFDTDGLNCGLYDIWFQLDFGGNRYISDRHKIQIYD